jgi:mRNA interferase MazF
VTYSLADVLLVDFPLTDRRGVKRRPGLVVLDIGDDDVMIAPITSQDARSNYDIEINDWEGAGLAMSSLVRTAKLSTIDKMFVKRKLGELQEQDKIEIKKALTELWAL